MSATTSTFSRDANFVPIWTRGLIEKKSITFDGATADAWGNEGGALDGGALFTVTGLVYASIIAVCNTDCAGGTNEVGVTGDTAIFLPTTTMTALDVGEIWFNSATPATHTITGGATPADQIPAEYILNGLNIIMTTKTANTTAGQVDFYCIWTPISEDGNVSASTL